jgi:hypothetical protein
MAVFLAALKSGRSKGTEEATMTSVFSTMTQRKKSTVLTATFVSMGAREKEKNGILVNSQV